MGFHSRCAGLNASDFHPIRGRGARWGASTRRVQGARTVSAAHQAAHKKWSIRVPFLTIKYRDRRDNQQENDHQGDTDALLDLRERRADRAPEV